jgi:AAA+ ATPase superfamily predicted ATPase
MESIEKLRMKRLYPGPVLILLCSSSVAWVEQEMPATLGEQSKRIDGKIKINPLNFLEVVRAFPQYQVSDCIRTYGVIGGVAGYINHWDQRKDLKTNICRNILNRNGYMHRAAEQLIAAELRELSVYETILYYIASGYDKLNELHLKTGYSRAKISVYMKNLGTFHIVEKETSFETGGWENTKKGVYRIKDNYVNFWFRFVYPHLSDLYMMTPEEFYDTYIEKDLDDYMNRYFVKVCREYLTLLNRIGKLPIDIHRIGTWVGKKGNIDIVAQNSVRESIVGICNWSEPYMTRSSGEALLDNLKQAKISAKYLYMFSAQEFAEDLKQMAEEDKRFVLIDMKEL